VLHYSYLTDSARGRLFARLPRRLGPSSSPQALAVGLGATLYTPGIRPDLAETVLKRGRSGCASMVLCLEDAVADADVGLAEDNVVAAVKDLARRDASALESLPLLFIRPRTPEQLLDVGRRLGAAAGLLTGFVLPKFENSSGRAERFLDALDLLNREVGACARTPDGAPRARPALLAMPIIEHPVTTHRETRAGALLGVRDLLRARQELILSVRLGTTDMSAAYGLRRTRDLTIYDVAVVAEVIADVVGLLGRADEGWVISGPVWEHYSGTERILRPQLRSTPFDAANSAVLRDRLLGANLDGLIREIELDLANGLVGKTVIHPSHVPVVHALHVVGHEEYLDALDIVDAEGGGAVASRSGARMNEAKPHRAWAQRTLARADAFGVARPDVTFADLLEASMK
jgi:citrate lyase beta subunit